MQIGVCGYTDKRPVIYALMKVLSQLGDIAVITNNRHYRRLLSDGAESGYLMNILVNVSDDSPDEVFESLELETSDFDHIIYDVVDSIPEETDLMIYVKTYGADDDENDFMELIEDYVTIKMTYDGKSEKDVFNVIPTANIMKSIEFIESYKVADTVNSKQLNIALAKMLAPKLDMNGNTLLKLLSARWK